MKRRDFIKTLGAAELAFYLNASRAASQTAGRPNVILCMADDLGWGDTGFNGSKKVKTPSLDKMASNGLRFERWYAGAPVCSPTRATCLTGRHHNRYGIPSANKGHMLPEELTLAEVLKSQGYATGHFGKWHLGTLTKQVKESNRGGPKGVKHYSPPWDNGFDVCFSTEAKTPTWWSDEAYERYGTHYWTGPEEMVPDVSGDDSKVIMDQALSFIEREAAAKTPFLAVIWFHTPHKPYLADAKHMALYSDLSEDEQKYYGCITAMDEQMGCLREKLRQLGIADNTMVWFGSDNGPERRCPGSPGPYRERKRSLHEGGIRVPGLLEWPARVKRARQINMPCGTMDYYPTVLDALGIDLPGQVTPIDGISLLPAIDGKIKERPVPIAFDFRGQSALSDNRYKLYRKGKKDYELYDMLKDPYEKNDIAATNPELVQTMRTELEYWIKSCRASSRGEDYSD